MTRHGVSNMNEYWEHEQRREIEKEYDDFIIPIRQDYRKKISNVITGIRETHENRKKHQQSIAIQISRLSPISCFTSIIMEIAGTGMLELYLAIIGCVAKGRADC